MHAGLQARVTKCLTHANFSCVTRHTHTHAHTHAHTRTRTRTTGKDLDAAVAAALEDTRREVALRQATERRERELQRELTAAAATAKTVASAAAARQQAQIDELASVLAVADTLEGRIKATERKRAEAVNEAKVLQVGVCVCLSLSLIHI